MTKRNRRRAALAPAATIAAIMLVFGGAAVGVGIARINAVDSYVACTITEREDRAIAELAERSPRIYTDCGVFIVQDEPFRLHFDAADVYNALEPGARLDLTTVGWRIGFLTWFPNIIEATESPK